MLKIIALIALAGCSPQAINDFITGEEKVMNQVIQDELGGAPIPMPPPIVTVVTASR